MNGPWDWTPEAVLRPFTCQLHESYQWLPGVDEKGPRKEGSAEGGEELVRSPRFPAC